MEVIILNDEATTVKVKRSGAPDVAPSGREDLCSGAFLGGEEGDDVAEDGIREVADAVGTSNPILTQSPPTPPSLGRRAARLHF
jgi:hypothetical protein